VVHRTWLQASPALSCRIVTVTGNERSRTVEIRVPHDR
jgi:hypothetical protein